jgi:hypothetical protein
MNKFDFVEDNEPIRGVVNDEATFVSASEQNI